MSGERRRRSWRGPYGGSGPGGKSGVRVKLTRYPKPGHGGGHKHPLILLGEVEFERAGDLFRLLGDLNQTGRNVRPGIRRDRPQPKRKISQLSDFAIPLGHRSPFVPLTMATRPKALSASPAHLGPECR